MKRWTSWVGLVGLALAVGGVVYRRDPFSGFLVWGVLGFLTLLLVWKEYRRAKTIRELSTQLRFLLAGSDVLDLSNYEEGELAVLSADIYKLMVAFREQAAKLREEKTWLSDSISDISHQLKTPITSILMLADLLKKDLPPERRRQFLEQLSSQSVRLQWLVQSLLTLSKLDAQAIEYHLAPVISRELLEKAAEPLRIMMDIKDQHLELQGELDMVLQVDKNWMAEALENILKNASEHGPNGSPILVTVENRPLSRVIEFTNKGEIRSEEIPHLFTRFYRGSRASKDSVGIGLAISRAIILQQEGQVEVRSGEGETTFTIRFPK